MTKLRDDGYMEIEGPVVAACFIGQRHLDFNGANRGIIYRVARDCVVSRKLLAVGYPILIPAKTVAEVCDDDLRIPKTLSEYGDFGRVQLTDWLRKHTGEGG